MATWQLQEAKGKFSEVVKRAQKEGPQNITVHGEAVAVIISRAEYTRLTQPKSRFLDFMRGSPLLGADVDFSRKQTRVREILL